MTRPPVDAPPRPRAPAVPVPARGRPAWAIGRHVTRSTLRGALIWGAVFALVVTNTVTGYLRAYPTAADRAGAARTFGSDAGLQALFGRGDALDTVAGFTAWRSLTLLTLVGAIWALLAATRIMRGEEDAGRWELLVAGPITRSRAAVATMAGLGVGLLALWAVVAAAALAVGRGGGHFSVQACLYFSVVLVASPAVFLAVGAFAAQVMPTRRLAASMAGAVLGASYLLRVAADGASGSSWLRWTTPLGWIEEMRPLTGSRPAALVPAVALVAALAAVTAVLAGRRDLGAGLVGSDDTARAHTRLLGGPAGLAARLVRGSALGWSAALAGAGLLTGLIARSAAEALSESERTSTTLGRLGAGQGAQAYLGVVFLIFATVVALSAAAYASATREEEAAGYLDNLLARPLGRVWWLGSRLLASAAALVVTGLATATGAWCGAEIRATGIPLDRMLAAGLNMCPAAILILGVGTLVHGLAPRATALVTYGLVAWSFLIELVASVLSPPDWLLDLSVFHHLALAPAADPQWSTNLVLLLLGALAATVGALAFRRRDLVTA